MSLTLTVGELVDLTDGEKPTAQIRQLRALGIPFIYTPGGPVKVLRTVLERHGGGAKTRKRVVILGSQEFRTS